MWEGDTNPQELRLVGDGNVETMPQWAREPSTRGVDRVDVRNSHLPGPGTRRHLCKHVTGNMAFGRPRARSTRNMSVTNLEVLMRAFAQPAHRLTLGTTPKKFISIECSVTHKKT